MSKPIILEIDNVRIGKFDERNYFVEREETYFSPKDNSDVTQYKFKGYYGTLFGALRSVHTKGLLINEESVQGLTQLLEQVEASERNIIKEIRGIRHGS